MSDLSCPSITFFSTKSELCFEKMFSYTLKASIIILVSTLVCGSALAFELDRDYFCATEDWRAFVRTADEQFQPVENFPAPEQFTVTAWIENDKQAVAMISGRQIVEAKYFEGNFDEGTFAAPKFGQILLERDDLSIHWSYLAPARGGNELTSVRLFARCRE